LIVIGITGGTGAGKTTALDALERLGARVIDCDALYHDLLETSGDMLRGIEARFPGVVTAGKLDRKALGRIVFDSPADLEALNAIVEDYVVRAVRDILAAEEAAGRDLAAIDAIGLFESRLDELCTFTVAVLAPREVRAERIMLREGITRAYAEMRIDAQKPDSFYEEKASYVLWNTEKSREAFLQKCTDFFTDQLNLDKGE